MNIYIIFTAILALVLGILLFPVLKDKTIPSKSRTRFSMLVVLFFTGGSFVLYNQFGTPEILPLLKEREEKLSELKEKIISNSELVKKDPKNIKAWVDLGDNFTESNQFSAAANAYRQGILITHGNPAIIMAYARSLILAADGTVTPEAKKSLDMLLILEPKNEEARYFQAMHKMQSGDTKNAMQEMKELYKSLPADSPLKDIIDRQIGRK
jgi:cytochrome c-type biogenesis protein CcmH